MLEHLELLWIFSKKSPDCSDGSITNIFLIININHNLIQSLNYNFTLIQLHAQNKHTQRLHHSINNDTINITNILSKLIDNITKILFTTVYLHELNFT